MNIYSIKNEKLGFFNRPIYCESDAEALSYIQNILMSDADRALRGLKGDLVLYKLGEINFVNGSIDPCCISDSNGGLMGEPVLICSLEEIFDSIPAESIKCIDKEIQLKFDAAAEEIANLKERLAEAENQLSKCKKVK